MRTTSSIRVFLSGRRRLWTSQAPTMRSSTTGRRRLRNWTGPLTTGLLMPRSLGTRCWLRPPLTGLSGVGVFPPPGSFLSVAQTCRRLRFRWTLRFTRTCRLRLAWLCAPCAACGSERHFTAIRSWRSRSRTTVRLRSGCPALKRACGSCVRKWMTGNGVCTRETIVRRGFSISGGKSAPCPPRTRAVGSTVGCVSWSTVCGRTG